MAVMDSRSIERLPNSLFRLKTKKHERPTLLPLCEEYPPVTDGECNAVAFDDVIMTSQLTWTQVTCLILERTLLYS